MSRAKRLPAGVSLGGPSRTEETGAGRIISSAMSKLPSRSGLAISRMPGSVVPGPRGSLTSAVVGGTRFADAVGDGDAAGFWLAGPAAVGEVVLLGATRAARGSCGAAR